MLTILKESPCAFAHATSQQPGSGRRVTYYEVTGGQALHPLSYLSSMLGQQWLASLLIICTRSANRHWPYVSASPGESGNGDPGEGEGSQLKLQMFMTYNLYMLRDSELYLSVSRLQGYWSHRRVHAENGELVAEARQ